MTMANSKRTYQLKALTDLWTGDVDGKSDHLIPTGLLGSIRWWSEILVRGLGGSACDPSNTPCEGRNHCMVCELFGCTGWARKFRFQVLDGHGNTKAEQIKKDQTFNLRFTPNRPIRNEEWALLDATLRLIADYGAIGGKTVFKPTDESSRADKIHHQDYGLVEFNEPPIINTQAAVVKEVVAQGKWRKLNHGDFAWASLQHFWCVNGKYLGRINTNKSTFNQVLGRPEPKQQSAQNDSWIAGRRPDRRNNIEAESKKVFSFKNPPRTFGFVKPGLIDFKAIQQRLSNVWGQGGWEFLTGSRIIEILFAKKEACS